MQIVFIYVLFLFLVVLSFLIDWWLFITYWYLLTFLSESPYCLFTLRFIAIQQIYYNRPFAHSIFDSKITRFIFFYASYFYYDGQNGTRFSKGREKDNKFENNVLIICRYLNLVRNQRII